MSIELKIIAASAGELWEMCRALGNDKTQSLVFTATLADDPTTIATTVRMRDSSPVAPVSGAAEPSAPAKRQRRTKAQIEQDRKELADRQAAEVKTLQAVDDAGLLDDPSDEDALTDADDEFDLLGEGTTAAPPRTLTQADMMAAGRAVMDAKGLPGLGAILQRHGFKKVAEIPEHAYAAVMADLEKAVA